MKIKLKTKNNIKLDDDDSDLDDDSENWNKLKQLNKPNEIPSTVNNQPVSSQMKLEADKTQPKNINDFSNKNTERHQNGLKTTWQSRKNLLSDDDDDDDEVDMACKVKKFKFIIKKDNSQTASASAANTIAPTAPVPPVSKAPLLKNKIFKVKHQISVPDVAAVSPVSNENQNNESNCQKTQRQSKKSPAKTSPLKNSPVKSSPPSQASPSTKAVEEKADTKLSEEKPPSARLTRINLRSAVNDKNEINKKSPTLVIEKPLVEDLPKVEPIVAPLKPKSTRGRKKKQDVEEETNKEPEEKKKEMSPKTSTDEVFPKTLRTEIVPVTDEVFESAETKTAVQTTIIKATTAREILCNENKNDNDCKSNGILNKAEVKKTKINLKTVMSDDDDDDEVGQLNIKKFKFKFKSESNAQQQTSLSTASTTITTIISATSSTVSESTDSTHKPFLKNKIFNFKNRNASTASNDSDKPKTLSYKLNFNQDKSDDECSTDREPHDDDDDNAPKSSKNGQSGSKLAKSNSLKLPKKYTETTKQASLVKSNSMNQHDKKFTHDKLADMTMEVNLRNTRKAYECEELGEAQAFLDDFDYLVEGLSSEYKLSERCLSLIKLAEQCLSSEFRMNLRSSVSNDDYYLNKLFKLLHDSINYKSLSLCACLIMYELTQDKLLVDIDKSLFNLIISIVNMNETTPDALNGDANTALDTTRYAYLNDLQTINGQQSNKRLSSTSSSLSNSPSSLLNQNNNNNGQKETHNELDLDENDDYVYKKISSKCKALFYRLNPLTMNATHEHELNFNSQLLSLDCLLNLNKHTKNLILNENYSSQLRDLKILDKLVIRLRFILNFFLASSSTECPLTNYLLDKFISCFNLLQTVTQPNYAARHKPIGQAATNSKFLPICDKNTNVKIAEFIQNQNYLTELKKSILIDLIKQALQYFYERLTMPKKRSSKNSPEITRVQQASNQTNQNDTNNLITNCVKEIFLLLINLTHNNEINCEKLSLDENLIDGSFKYLIIDNELCVWYINESQQFDILIMSLGYLLNMFVNSFKKRTSLNLLKYKNKKSRLNSIEIVLKLYLTKEKLVQIAEDDQENEFNQLNEQIESQNIENINLSIMNSIHKAGKHMEDHIIAAHCALIIGYMLLNDAYLNTNDEKLFNVELIRSRVKDNSFTYMIQIIRKFVVFMNIMKVTGFSAEEHIEIILNYLEKLNNSSELSTI